jgi:hypothetical protein
LLFFTAVGAASGKREGYYAGRSQLDCFFHSLDGMARLPSWKYFSYSNMAVHTPARGASYSSRTHVCERPSMGTPM